MTAQGAAAVAWLVAPPKRLWHTRQGGWRAKGRKARGVRETGLTHATGI